MYTTDTLVDAAKRNISLPSSSIKFNDTDIIAFMNEELQWLIAPALANTNEQYFTERHTITLVANQSKYILPKTASCWEFDSIYWVNSDGYRNRIYQKTRGGESEGANTSSIPDGFYFEDSSIILTPNMSGTPNGSLEIVYRRLQNLLREVDNCAVIQTVADMGLTWDLGVNVAPIGYSNGVDFINKDNPYNLFARHITPVVAGLTVTVTKTDLDRTPVIGDYIAESGYTPVPHIPSEWHSILAVATSIRMLRASGDKGNLSSLESQLGAMLQMMNQTAKERAVNHPKKIVSRNWALNASRYRWRW
jgi:hypothetical protein